MSVVLHKASTGSGVEKRSRGVEKAGSFAAESAATERLLPVFMCRVVPKAGLSALGLAGACVRSSIHDRLGPILQDSGRHGGAVHLSRVATVRTR